MKLVYREKKFNTTQLAPNSIIVLYTIVDLTRLFNYIPRNIGNLLYVFVGFLALSYTVYKAGVGKQMSMLTFILLYNIFGAVGILFNGNMDFVELLWPFAFIPVAMLMLNFTLSCKLTKRIYYLIAIIFMASILSSGGVSDLNTVSSKNSLGFMLLIYFSIYAISSYRNNEKITIIPGFIGLMVTIVTMGRSSMITFLVIVMATFLFEFNGKHQRIRNPYKWIPTIVLLIVIALIFNNYFETYLADSIRYIESRGMETSRNFIWKDYFKTTTGSISNIFFGTPIKGTFWLDQFSGNLHNSFLMLHAKYGIIPLTIIITLIAKSMIFFWREKNYLFMTILVAVLIRMQFDYTNFNAMLDIVLFYLLFYRTYAKKTTNH